MSGFSAEDWLVPQWPAPPRVRACVTTRNGGMSTGPYASLNLGGHVGDDPAAVRSNRVFLAQTLGVQVRWLDQVHGTEVVEQTPAWPDGGAEGMPLRADAVFSCQPGVVCAVLTADCLPVLLCNRTGSWVAAVHAGWRGLAAGVIEATLARHPGPASELLAWLGPAIGPQAFEVGGRSGRHSWMNRPCSTTVSGLRWRIAFARGCPENGFATCLRWPAGACCVPGCGMGRLLGERSAPGMTRRTFSHTGGTGSPVALPR